MYNTYKIDGQYISRAINTFYDLIKDKDEGAPDTRYRSWEWCYEAFKEEKAKYRVASDEEKAKIVDYLSIHLAFYLASWGMYRGSSYLLQRDYKAHKNTVKILLEDRYDTLWEYEPNEASIEEQGQNKLIFGDNGLYNRIKNAYNDYPDSEDEASDTLVTKIIMGTMGCVPAFDRFLKRGIKWLKENYDAYKSMSANVEGKKNNGKTFVFLEKFAFANKDALIVEGASINYPVMKCVDMLLWQIGFEFDILDGLNSSQNSNAKKGKLKKSAIKLGICAENADLTAVKEAIQNRWQT